jgi:hypothetical protein
LVCKFRQQTKERKGAREKINDEITKELFSETPSTSFIIARNWDRLGGRILEIVNGLYIAERFKVPFRFVWPSDARFPEVNDLLQLFSQEFLSRHLIDVSALRHIPEILVHLDGTVSQEDFHGLLTEPAELKAIRIADFMKIPKIVGDSNALLLNSYSRVAESIWSPEVSEYSREFDREYKTISVLHCRFGDLVTGEWRNWVEPSKYITALQIEEVVQANATSGAQTQLVSDSMEIFQLFPGLYISKDLRAEKRINLNPESLQLVTDLMRMKSSKEVLAPEASAFSTFGARLGGKEVGTLRRSRIDIWQAMENAEKTKALWSRLRSRNRGAFISRDIDQQVNSLGGIYDLPVFGEVTKAAFEADPTNVVSINNRAIFFALSGDRAECEGLTSLAKEKSLGVIKIHHDPLFMTLAVESLSNLILLLHQASGVAGGSKGLELGLMNPGLRDLEPYQLDKKWVIESFDRMFLELDKQQYRDSDSNSGFYSEILLQALFGRFNGPLKSVFFLNVIQSIMSSLFPDALVNERDALVHERDALVHERDALVHERDALVHERDALVNERDLIIATKTWRWSKPARALVAWVRARRHQWPLTF